MPSLFLSYSRADDEAFVKRLYGDLTAQGLTVWWDRAAMESRGRTFLQELRDAIDQVDRVVAVIGPGAVRSDYVRAEWDHARLFAKGVIPLLRAGTYELVPLDLSHFHGPDFRDDGRYTEALGELVRLLTAPVAPLGPVLSVIPALPPHFMPRLDCLSRLRAAVLADVERPVVVAPTRQVTALVGMGGSGKSVIAAAFGRSADVRRAFADGVLWLTAGEHPDFLATLRMIGTALKDAESISYVDPQPALTRLPQLLSGLACLIVLDDVWDADAAVPLVNVLGPRCRLLFTTRDAGIATALAAEEVRVEMLSDADALKLLAEWANQTSDALPEVARHVADECDNLPFALALCGAMVRDKVPWTDLLDALREADLSFIDAVLPNYPHRNMMRSIRVSVDALGRENAQSATCYNQLAVFPKDTVVPEAVVLMLWTAEGVRERDAHRLLGTFDRKALLRLEGEVPNRKVWLHDLLFDYLIAASGERNRLHERFLQAYAARCPHGWVSGPNDGYYFQHLPWHLREAGRTEELERVVGSYGWIDAKLKAAAASELLADYDLLPSNHELRLVKGAVRLSVHVISKELRELPSQILGRLLGCDSELIRDLCRQTMDAPRTPWLMPLQASLTKPGGTLIRTLEGHTAVVYGVAVTRDGRHAISVSGDRNIKIWNLETGTLLRDLVGHTDVVTAVAATPEGKRAVSGSNDQTLKVWDVETGRVLRDLVGHTGWVSAVAVTPDGKCAVSASNDQTLKVWDLDTGRVLRDLVGHMGGVSAVAVTPDGKYAVSASDDHTLKVWDLQTGTVLHAFADATRPVAVTPDGRRTISGSVAGTLKVRETETGTTVLDLVGHTEVVTAVAVTPDGRRAVSASQDHTLKLWNLDTGASLCDLAGHKSWVTAVAVTPDGKHAVSASFDCTLKVWDLEAGTLLRDVAGRTSAVTAVAVTFDGERAITALGDRTLKIWDLETGTVLRDFDGHTGWVSAIAVTPDDKSVVSASNDGTLKVWDPETGAMLRFLGAHADAVNDVAVMPDGRRAISASRDGTLGVWDLQTGTVRRIVAHSWLTAVAVTPDGKRAISASHGGMLKLWDLETGDVVRNLAGHTSHVYGVAVTPDGKRAVSAPGDGTPKIWDLETGSVLRELAGHTGWVRAVKVMANGKHAVTASDDGTLRLWDIETGEAMPSFTAETGLKCLALVMRSRVLAGDQDGTLHLLSVEGSNGFARPN